jgi:hypothetical protein
MCRGKTSRGWKSVRERERDREFCVRVRERESIASVRKIRRVGPSRDDVNISRRI